MEGGFGAGQLFPQLQGMLPIDLQSSFLGVHDIIRRRTTEVADIVRIAIDNQGQVAAYSGAAASDSAAADALHGGRVVGGDLRAHGFSFMRVY